MTKAQLSMTIAELEREIAVGLAGLNPGSLHNDLLDEAVHERHAGQAAEVNNGGIAAQLRYLFNHYTEEEVRGIIRNEFAAIRTGVPTH